MPHIAGIDNLNPPFLPMPNNFNIGVDADYREMINTISKAYQACWRF
jgi:hypothetical protein